MLSQKALSPESGRLGADHIHRPHTTAKDLSMAATTASTAAENSPATNGFSSSVSTASAGVPLH